MPIQQDSPSKRLTPSLRADAFCPHGAEPFGSAERGDVVRSTCFPPRALFARWRIICKHTYSYARRESVQRSFSGGVREPLEARGLPGRAAFPPSPPPLPPVGAVPRTPPPGGWLRRGTRPVSPAVGTARKRGAESARRRGEGGAPGPGAAFPVPRATSPRRAPRAHGHVT